MNLGKLEMILVGEVDDIGAFAQLLGCRVASLQALYLGLPLGSPYRANLVWDSAVETSEEIGMVEATISIKGR